MAARIQLNPRTDTLRGWFSNPVFGFHDEMAIFGVVNRRKSGDAGHFRGAMERKAHRRTSWTVDVLEKSRSSAQRQRLDGISRGKLGGGCHLRKNGMASSMPDETEEPWTVFSAAIPRHAGEKHSHAAGIGNSGEHEPCSHECGNPKTGGMAPKRRVSHRGEPGIRQQYGLDGPRRWLFCPGRREDRLSRMPECRLRC